MTNERQAALAAAMTLDEARNLPSYVRGVLLAFMEPDDERLAVIVGRVEVAILAIETATLGVERPAGKHRHDDGCGHLPRVPWEKP